MALATPTVDGALVAAPPEQHLPRLPFIDGLRGIAAIIVAVGHALRLDPSVFPRRGSRWIGDASAVDLMLWPFRFGSEMVVLFLLVSAFSLVYSEDVRRSRGLPKSSFATYLKRRAWRIAPLYYVAFVVGFVVLAFPQSTFDSTYLLENVRPTWSGSLAHIGFLHNWDPLWLSQGNAPLWTLAYEAQLYLVLPALLLAMRRAPALLVAIPLIVAAEFAAVHTFLRGELITAFVLGALLALWYRRVPSRFAPHIAVLALLALGVAVVGHPGFEYHQERRDLLWSGTFVLLLLAMTLAPTSRLNPCNLPALRSVGLRSYSLYALHYPVLLSVYAAALAVGVPAGLVMPTVLVVGIPMTVGVVEIAYRRIERPSLSRSAATR